MNVRKKTTTRTLRIIGGNWRSRKVTFADTTDIRPTGDRVRETLFNWLMHDIAGSTFADLFSGSGILAIEALSRGAAHVDIVDTDAATVTAIRENLRVLGAEPSRYRVRQATADGWIREAGPVDIVFIDPPFDSELLYRTCERLADRKLVRKAAYVESGTPLDEGALPPGWVLHRQKRAGQVHYGLIFPERQ